MKENGVKKRVVEYLEEKKNVLKDLIIKEFTWTPKNMKTPQKLDIVGIKKVAKFT